MCASSNYSIPTSNPVSYGDLNSASCPFSDITGYTSFSNSTIPGAFSFSGRKSDFSVSDIHFEEDNISFNFSTCSVDINEVESNILWQESFKSNDVLKHWEQTNIVGKAQWDRFNNLGESSVKHYLSLIPNKNYINPHKIKTKLLSPKISLMKSSMVYEIPSNQSSELIFSAKIRNITKNTSTWNFCFVDSENILSEYKVDLEPSKEWFQLIREMSIDLSQRESIRLIIETEMEIGADSRLELSDLNLIFQEPSAHIPIIFEDCFSEGNYKIFDVSGRMVQLYDIAKVPNGIYIIKSKAGAKKIMINDNSKITILENLRSY